METIADTSGHYHVLQKRPRRLGTVVGQASILLLSIGCLPYAPEGVSAKYMGLTVILATLVVVFQCLQKVRESKPVNWLSVDIVFMVPFVVVHFTLPLFWLLGLIEGSRELWVDESVVGYASMMAVSGLGAFAVGFNLLGERVHDAGRVIQYQKANVVRAVGLGIFTIGAIVWIVFVGVAKELLFEGSYSGARGTYVVLIGQALQRVCARYRIVCSDIWCCENAWATGNRTVAQVVSCSVHLGKLCTGV